MFSEFYSFCFFLFYMHDKSYSSGLFLCIPIRERELSADESPNDFGKNH
ncbi:hypothetical protein EC970264_0080 [Escherichia coli 97.0264]|nr:hypothetical protein EC970264_0080 [Escherichia coli 97.0264]